ncbi:RNA-directed DNA polymerase from mobile element jockey [Eumeta japonica]|uniref:RNA-directed DNA polymerase from mobile element jockey n=1 Tax=Eumeta variegata TaxID=151549 RepID=A0A4C2A4I4_EUMVA|nr:RNA-directed DNA polymerase from mobile element jockey [Eumeta japonica]
MGRIIAIPKAGKDPRLASSQHPITLLSHITKLFERIMLRRLLRHLTPIQEQFGFRSGLYNAPAGASTTSHGRRAQPGAPHRWSPSRYREGVRPSVALRTAVQANRQSDPACVYTDDSAYLASTRRADLAAAKLQRVLDLLPDWLDRWRVAVNVTKTAALLTGQRRTMPPKLRLRGQEVEWQTRVRYLGVQTDRSMHMAAQEEHVTHQSRAAWSMLRPVLRSRLPLRTKVALYKGYIRSRLTYAAPAWYALCSASQRKKIQAQQNITLRTIVEAGRYVINDVFARDLCIETVEEFIQRLLAGCSTSLIR